MEKSARILGVWSVQRRRKWGECGNLVVLIGIGLVKSG